MKIGKREEMCLGGYPFVQNDIALVLNFEQILYLDGLKTMLHALLQYIAWRYLLHKGLEIQNSPMNQNKDSMANQSVDL